MSYTFQIETSTEGLKESFQKIEDKFIEKYGLYETWSKTITSNAETFTNLNPEATVNMAVPQDAALMCRAVVSLTKIINTLKRKKPLDFTQVLDTNLKAIGLTAASDVKLNSDGYVNYNWGTKTLRKGTVQQLGWTSRAASFATTVNNCVSVADRDELPIMQLLDSMAGDVDRLKGEDKVNMRKAYTQLKDAEALRHRILQGCFRQVQSLIKAGQKKVEKKTTGTEGLLQKIFKDLPMNKEDFEPLLQTYCQCAVLINDLLDDDKEADWLDEIDDGGNVNTIHEDVFGSATLFSDKEGCKSDMKRVIRIVNKSDVVTALKKHRKYGSCKNDGAANASSLLKSLKKHYPEWK